MSCCSILVCARSNFNYLILKITVHLFFLLYLLHSITLAIRLVAYANFKTQKKRAESSRLSSRPSRLHEKMQKGIEKSPTEIKRFVIFFPSQTGIM